MRPDMVQCAFVRNDRQLTIVHGMETCNKPTLRDKKAYVKNSGLSRIMPHVDRIFIATIGNSSEYTSFVSGGPSRK